jgi:hypothetical protein
MRIGRYLGEFVEFGVKFFDFLDVVDGGDGFWGIGEMGDGEFCARASEEKEKAGAG